MNGIRLRTGMSAEGKTSKAGGDLCATVGSVGQEVARTQTFNHRKRMTAPATFTALFIPGAVMLETTTGVGE